MVIGENCHFGGKIVVKDHSQTVVFGDHSTSVSVCILCQEGANVRIGRWCMLSRDIEIRTTDAHSVIDRETGKRLNTPASITIGDHVWVGVGAIINKGGVHRLGQHRRRQGLCEQRVRRGGGRHRRHARPHRQAGRDLEQEPQESLLRGGDERLA